MFLALLLQNMKLYFLAGEAKTQQQNKYLKCLLLEDSK